MRLRGKTKSHGITLWAPLHECCGIILAMAPWIDTHCHLDAPEFASDREQVRARAAQAGVGHPLCTGRASDDDLSALDLALARHRDDPRLLAVGEIGLDFFVPGLDPVRQEFFYREQLALARKHGLPVILHVRRSADRLLKGLRGASVSGIAHAFNGSQQQASQFLDLGFKLGFGGNVTYERAQQIRRLASALPLDALVMETDSPDIPPHWLYATAQQREAGQAQGRNEPAELPRIAQVLAQLRGIEPAALAQATTGNACQALPGLGTLLGAS
jgi:TatD DNase family protein